MSLKLPHFATKFNKVSIASSSLVNPREAGICGRYECNARMEIDSNSARWNFTGKKIHSRSSHREGEGEEFRCVYDAGYANCTRRMGIRRSSRPDDRTAIRWRLKLTRNLYWLARASVLSRRIRAADFSLFPRSLRNTPRIHISTYIYVYPNPASQGRPKFNDQF